MNGKFVILLLLAFLLYSFGCSNNPVGPGSVGPALSGTVTDLHGAPLSGVGVHYIFHLDSVSTPSAQGKTLPTVLFRFSVETDTVVSLALLRYGTRELILNIIDHEHMTAGVHAAEFDATLLTNGLYIMHLTIGNFVSERILALLQDTSHLVQTRPLTTTDARGHFSLPISVFGIGTHLTEMNESFNPYTVKVSDTIQVVLTRENVLLFMKTVVVDTTQSLSMTFRMGQ
jgi:hypothetical protein